MLRNNASVTDVEAIIIIKEKIKSSKEKQKQ